MRLLLTLVFSAIVSQSLSADYIYTFDGVLPSGASSHNQVDDGESFVATFVIDGTVADSEPGDTSLGIYASAVLSGNLVFSGGYVADLDFTGANVLVGDNVVSGNMEIDAIQVSTAGQVFVVQANSFDDLTQLTTDALPTAGDSLNASGSVASGFFQLTMVDSGGSILYAAEVDNNVNFSATAVPEPTGIAAAVSALLVFRRSRRQ